MSEYNYGPLEHELAGGTSANDNWCDDCHGYTHMPWCPSCKEPDEAWISHFDSHHRKGEPCNQCEHEQPASVTGRETWQRRDNEVFVHRQMTPSELQEARAKGFKTSDIRYTIARFYGDNAERNAQRAIEAVEQNERLREALRDMCDKFYPHGYRPPAPCDRCATLVKASRVLNHAEQEEGSVLRCQECGTDIDREEDHRIPADESTSGIEIWLCQRCAIG